MARQERNSVDYFPFICKEGKAMFYIENKYNNDGFAVWVKLLRQLATTNYHYLHLNDKAEVMMLSAKCRVSEILLLEIIKDLVELGEFDKDLWEKCKVLWSEKFIDSISDAYKKRNNECINEEVLREILISKGLLNKPKSKSFEGKSKSQGVVKPHSIVEYSKEDNNNSTQLSVEETFNLFWDYYHEQTGKKKTDRKPALKKWKALTLEERKKAYRSVSVYSKSNKSEFLKKARTYLEDKSFDDEFEEVEKKVDVKLWVKNHLTYDQVLGEVAVHNDQHPEYNGLYYNRNTGDFQKDKAI